MKFNEVKEMVQKMLDSKENFTIKVKNYLPFVMKNQQKHFHL